jgi:small subunit ribosomal protein S3
MAERLAYSLDRGRHYRRAAYYILRKVMDAGALGVEISIAGKVTSQRAKTQRFRTGTMAKSGQLSQIGVDKGIAQCITKTGVLGVKVKIMRPNVRTGDGVKINEELLKQAEVKAEADLAKLKAEGPVKKEYEVVEEEKPLIEEEKELIDEVDEEDTSEISLEPENENEKENLKNKNDVKDNEDSES